MEVKISKKSYYLPDILMEIFRNWCKPGRDYSPKVAGAILYYMSLSPDIREACEKAAHLDKSAIENTIKLLSDNDNKVKSDRGNENPGTLSKQILNLVQDAQSKSSRKKRPPGSKKSIGDY